MTEEEIIQRLDQGTAQFAQIRDSLEEITEQLRPLPQMQKDITATKEIVDAWGAVKTGGKFIKWLAGVIAAIGIIIAATKVAAGRWLS